MMPQSDRQIVPLDPLISDAPSLQEALSELAVKDPMLEAILAQFRLDMAAANGDPELVKAATTKYDLAKAELNMQVVEESIVNESELFGYSPERMGTLARRYAPLTVIEA